MEKKSKFDAPKYKIKKGDTVLVVSGSNKGAKGEVKQVLRSVGRVIVDGINMAKKHSKPTNDNPGGIVEIESPIHISNVMLVDPKSGKPSRIGIKTENGVKTRFYKKSGEVIK